MFLNIGRHKRKIRNILQKCRIICSLFEQSTDGSLLNMLYYKLYHHQIKSVRRYSISGGIFKIIKKLFKSWAFIFCLFPGLLIAGPVQNNRTNLPSGGNAEPPSADSTLVRGIISGYQVWNSESNPYVLAGDLFVTESATLEINEGVKILAKASPVSRNKPDHKEGFAIFVYGTLMCRGTAGSPVEMIPLGNEPEPGCWGGIRFGDSSVDASFDTCGAYSSGSIVEWTNVSYAGSSAVLCRRSSPYIHNCSFTQNIAYRDQGDPQVVDPYAKPDERIKGGAIFLFRPDSDTRIEECTFSRNFSRHMGGAIAVIESFDVPVSIADCVFDSNKAELSGGGAIRLLGSSVDISNCLFTGNSAIKGGAIHTSYHGTGTFKSNIFSGNHAYQVGGGIFIAHRSSPLVSDNTFLNNYAVFAARGGALALWDHVCPEIASNLITGNSSSGGSAIACYLLDRCELGHANIHDNEIRDNISAGGRINTAILLVDTDYLEMRDNTIVNPSEEFEIHCKYYISDEPSESIINADANFWGEIDLDQLESRIFHHPDSLNLPTIDYTPTNTGIGNNTALIHQ